MKGTWPRTEEMIHSSPLYLRGISLASRGTEEMIHSLSDMVAVADRHYRDDM